MGVRKLFTFRKSNKLGAGILYGVGVKDRTVGHLKSDDWGIAKFIIMENERDETGNNIYSFHNNQSFRSGQPNWCSDIPILKALKYNIKHECPSCLGSNIIDECDAGCDEGTTECMQGCDAGYHDCDYGCEEGYLNCGECEGDGWWDCHDCNGDGYNYCEDCDGDGSIKCEMIDNHGEECPACEGGGVVFDSSTNIELYCDDCQGGGVIICDACNNTEKIDCDICDGESTLSCNECEGDGRIRCGYCEGEGCYSCDNCYDGYIECGCDEGFQECIECDGLYEGGECYHDSRAALSSRLKESMPKEYSNTIIMNWIKGVIIRYMWRWTSYQDKKKGGFLEKLFHIANKRNKGYIPGVTNNYTLSVWDKFLPELKFKVKQWDEYGNIDLSKYKFNSVTFIHVAGDVQPSRHKSKNKYNIAGCLLVIKHPDSLKYESIPSKETYVEITSKLYPPVDRVNYMRSPNMYNFDRLIRAKSDNTLVPQLDESLKTFPIFDKRKITIIETNLKFKEISFVNWINSNPVEVKL